MINQDLQDEIIGKLVEILQIVKKYPQIYNEGMLSIGIKGKNNYINLFMFDPEKENSYLLNYVTDSYIEDLQKEK